MKNIGKKLHKQLKRTIWQLHEGLTNRFVDPNSKYFIKSNENEFNQNLSVLMIK